MKKMIRNIADIGKKIGRDHLGTFASSAAFFVLLSFVPFMMLLLTIIPRHWLNQDYTFYLVSILVPENKDIQMFFRNILQEVYGKSTAIGWVSGILALWSAGKGIQALTHGFNEIYNVTETRNYFVMRIRSSLDTFLLLLAVLGSLLLQVFGNTIQKIISKYFPIISKITGYLIGMRTLVSLVVLVTVLLLIYKILPNRSSSFKSQLPGAIISAIAWSLFSLGFSIYLDIFGFSDMYGSLTTLILVLLWLYFCMYIVLIGAELNVYFERNRKWENEL